MDLTLYFGEVIEDTCDGLVSFKGIIQSQIDALKEHSQFCHCADLDTSYSHFEKSLPQPEIKVHLEILLIFRSVLLDFQSLTEKPVFECPLIWSTYDFIFIISG